MPDIRDNLERPRYCDLSFPPYRFVPGRNPHPTAHPDGHSYEPPGTNHEPVEYVSPEGWALSPDYLYGADLYNHAYWWEAHEAWEGLWQLTDKSGTQGYFLQGIIQVAACHLKLYIGHRDGVERLLASSLGYLRRVAEGDGFSHFMGLNLVDFIEAVHHYYTVSVDKASMRTEHDLQKYPYLTLRKLPEL